MCKSGVSQRYDVDAGADHYDQLKLVHGQEPKVAHVMSGYRHPLKQYEDEG